MEVFAGLVLLVALFKVLAWLFPGRPGDRTVTRYSTRTVGADGSVTRTETVTTVTLVTETAAPAAPAAPPLPRAEVVSETKLV